MFYFYILFIKCQKKIFLKYPPEIPKTQGKIFRLLVYSTYQWKPQDIQFNSKKMKYQLCKAFTR